jgi:hypothetical protein
MADADPLQFRPARPADAAGIATLHADVGAVTIAVTIEAPIRMPSWTATSAPTGWPSGRNS